MKNLAAAFRAVCEQWDKDYHTGCSPSISDVQVAFRFFADVIDPPEFPEIERRKKISRSNKGKKKPEHK